MVPVTDSQDTHNSGQVDEQMPTRLSVAVFFVLLGGGLAASAYLPEFQWVLGLAYVIAVVLIAASVATLLNRIGNGRGR